MADWYDEAWDCEEVVGVRVVKTKPQLSEDEMAENDDWSESAHL
ncbi:MAG: hypothetical protein ACK5MN_05820 [Lachnospiraceae bacterium]